MIVYGSSSTHLITEPILENCPSCNKLNSLYMSVFQKYAHVFWIPFFPIGKVGATQCTHCQQVLRHTHFTIPLRNHYDILKSQTKTPIWTFAFLIIISLIAAGAIIATKKHQSDNAANILAPRKGDVYEIKLSFSKRYQILNSQLPALPENSATDALNKYTLNKVDSVGQDDVFVFQNQYETDKISGLKEMRSKGVEGYDTISYPISIKDLKTMFDEGEIIDIERD